jgi:hypothetical protein
VDGQPSSTFPKPIRSARSKATTAPFRSGNGAGSSSIRWEKSTMSAFRCAIGPDTRITFPDKPSEAIRALLKSAGFRWLPSAGCWWRRGVRGAADFLAALERKLNPRPDGACWRCQSPEGYFRPHGDARLLRCLSSSAQRGPADRFVRPGL